MPIVPPGISRPRLRATPATRRRGTAISRPAAPRFARNPHLPAPNKPNRRSRPERSAAQSNGSAHRSALSPSAPNKANFPRFQPKNTDRPQKQTQSNPIGEAILSEAQRSRMDLASVLIQPSALSEVDERGSRTDLTPPQPPPLPGCRRPKDRPALRWRPKCQTD
jgi:hypothetical protein